MANVGYATLDVIPSLRGFRSKLEQGTSSDFAAVGRTGGKKFGEAAGKEAGSSFKGRFAEGVKGIAAPLAGIFAGAAIIDTFKDAISGASDLAESGNKIQAIFGEAANDVQGFARSAATELGQTQVQALDAASTFGTFGKAAGLTGSELAGFSEKLVGLSADMASFFNTSPDQAIEAIGAALRGEAEPIRAYGVLLDDATLRQEALRQGLITTTKQALTPQQKVLAAYQVILQQTSDAQGDFGRTSGGLANQQRILAAQWAEMKTTLGTKLLPAAVGVAHAFNDDVIPAVSSAGGVLSDVAQSFNSLPTPVKAATAAFVVFRASAAAGLNASIASGVSSLGGTLTNLRIRTMLAADAFRTARAGVYDFNGNVGRIVAPVGRASASLSALRTGAIGAGGAIKKSLSGAASLVGGPWGLAFIAATATVAHFWSENKKAKQFVDDLTGSLDKQTGAVTDNTREIVFNSLQKSGAIDAAKTLGISLEDVRKAALGNRDAMAAVNTVLQQNLKYADISPEAYAGFTQAQVDGGKAAKTLSGALGDTSGAIGDARDGARDYADFMGRGKDAVNDTADANKNAGDSFKSLADRIADAKDKIESLAKAEQKRRLANLKNRQDKLALIEAMQATAAEASNSTEVGDINKQIRDAQQSGAKERADLRKQLGEKGADKGDINSRIAESMRDESAAVADLRKKLGEYTKTLNPATKAGQENLQSLYDLADQWNNSSGAVRNAKGAYHEIRQSFIDSAMQMGDTRKQAEKLADKILLVPKRKRIDVTTPGMKQALEDLRALRERVKAANKLAVYVNTKQANDPRLKGFASGGKVGGTGYGDKQLILADSREWVMNPSASAYYGDAFMSALNRMQIPRYASGGPVSQSAGPVVRAGSTYHVTVVADDPWKWKRDMEHMQRANEMGAVSFR